ncbi:MAG: type II secretion system F family protein [Clostridiaceae bacterium]
MKSGGGTIGKYVAMDIEGRKKRGKFYGEDRKELVRMLKEEGYYLLKIKEDIGIHRTITAKKVKARELSLICKQMYLLLNAGITISDALYIVYSSEKNSRVSNALKQAYKSVSSGETLHKSLKMNGSMLPDFFVYMVKFGEETGNLDSIFNNLSLYYEKQDRIYNKIKGDMVYPAVVLFTTLIMVTAMVLWFIPGFEETLTGLGGELPGFTSTIMFICSAIKDNSVFIAASILCSCTAFRFYIKTDRGRENFDSMKFKIPLLGKAFQKAQLSKLCRNMSTLADSGFNIIKSLEVLAGISENVVFRRKIERSADYINKGCSLAFAFSKAGIDDKIFISLVKTGEEAGNIEHMLLKAADFYEKDIEGLSERYLKLLEPALIIIMAVLIGTLIISVMLPILSIMDSI